MAFNIQDFRNSFRDGEPASPTNYEVQIIQQPRILVITEDNLQMRLPNIDIERDIKYRCIACTLPGKLLNTTERSTYGPNRKIANSAMYQDINFSFIVSDTMSELGYFTQWLNTIVSNTVLEGTSTHDVAYYDDYIGSLSITQYNKSGVATRKIQLKEAYPININEISLGWEQNNDYIKVDVTMAYKHWESVAV